MPARDGSGPQGMGSMTGRGMGPCSGNAAQGAGYGSWNAGNRWGGRGGRGAGRRGGGFGFGWRARAPFYDEPVAQFDAPPAMSRDQNVNWLKAQAEDLQAALQNITSRLAALDDQEEG
jgi:hypothetical protein